VLPRLRHRLSPSKREEKRRRRRRKSQDKRAQTHTQNTRTRTQARHHHHRVLVRQTNNVPFVCHHLLFHLLLLLSSIKAKIK
jgi:membrane carboxypeptidase/penicillin-binding protein PbpC